MKAAVNFTKKDVVVVLLCVLFALANIAAIRAGSRQRAKQALCLSNLGQWGRVWNTFVNDYAGYFPDPTDEQLVPEEVLRLGPRATWCIGLIPSLGINLPDNVSKHIVQEDYFLCPAATTRYDKGGRPPFGAWVLKHDFGPVASKAPGFVSSYGLNCWMLSSRKGRIIYKQQEKEQRQGWYWQTTNIPDAERVPVMGDATICGCFPRNTDKPPWSYSVNFSEAVGYAELKNFCTNRHDAKMNMLFADFSARSVGLKQLWRLKWNRKSRTDLDPPAWPAWMSDFKDYD